MRKKNSEEEKRKSTSVILTRISSAEALQKVRHWNRISLKIIAIHTSDDKECLFEEKICQDIFQLCSGWLDYNHAARKCQEIEAKNWVEIGLKQNHYRTCKLALAKENTLHGYLIWFLHAWKLKPTI